MMEKTSREVASAVGGAGGTGSAEVVGAQKTVGGLFGWQKFGEEGLSPGLESSTDFIGCTLVADEWVGSVESIKGTVRWECKDLFGIFDSGDFADGGSVLKSDQEGRARGWRGG